MHIIIIRFMVLNLFVHFAFYFYNFQLAVPSRHVIYSEELILVEGDNVCKVCTMHVWACVSSRGAQSTELVWILDFKQILLLLLLQFNFLTSALIPIFFWFPHSLQYHALLCSTGTLWFNRSMWIQTKCDSAKHIRGNTLNLIITPTCSNILSSQPRTTSQPCVTSLGFQTYIVYLPNRWKCTQKMGDVKIIWHP